ncbi:MAG TPA: PTS glucose transporter subunit IIA [Candidatus Faecousia intestinigallinarum]|nr:PTS glucose transporter subunit IIA [Candidatus Faecousia intestinigallinarum]
MGFFSKLFGKEKDAICAPVSGEAVPISQVSDPTFGEEVLGKGIAIRPTDGKVVAPCDATVDMMFETGHAVSLIADCGAEVLIHVGLDTVSLKGKHYTVHAKNGDKVKKGDLLMEFDYQAIAADGFDTITPVVICNSADYTTFETHVGKTVTAGEVVIELAK